MGRPAGRSGDRPHPGGAHPRCERDVLQRGRRTPRVRQGLPIGILDRFRGTRAADPPCPSGPQPLRPARQLGVPFLFAPAGEPNARSGTGLWSRNRERTVYKTVLRDPVAGSGAFNAMRDLRDLYMHGYGVPATEQRRVTLAQKLHSTVDRASATDAERALGYSGEVYFFGEHSTYSPRDKAVLGRFDPHRRADLSPLAAHRLLRSARDYVHAAHAAVLSGARPNLTADNCELIRVVQREIARPPRSPNTA